MLDQDHTPFSLPEKSDQLIEWFRHAVPYVSQHKGKTFVIKISGEAIASDHIHKLITDIQLLSSLGIRIVIVHGISQQLSQELEQKSIKSNFVNGTRVTTEEVLQTTISVNSLVRSRLESKLSSTNNSIGKVQVATANAVTAKPLGVINGIDMQKAGSVRSVDGEAISRLLDMGNLVLLSPICFAADGSTYNITAPQIAAEVAASLCAEKYISFITSNGVIDSDQQLIHEICTSEIALLKETKKLHNDPEMLRNLDGVVKAIHGGVQRAHMMSYKIDGALLQELFSVDGCGTLIQKNIFEATRQASPQDIPAILELIRPLERQGVLVKRERSWLEKEIENFYVTEREGIVIALAALYLYSDSKSAELACIVTHPNYQQGSRAKTLLARLVNKAQKFGIQKLFVLTTQTEHWFLEQGFTQASIEDLPEAKQQLYNFKRNSKVLIKVIE